MSSIRRFLVVVLLATMTLINFLAALHGYRSSMAEADRLFDAKLMDIAAVLAAVPVAAGERASIAAPLSDGGIVFQIWQDSILLLASADAPAEAIASQESGYTDVNFNGYRWRAFSRSVKSADSSGNKRWIVVAERIDLRFRLAENVILESVLPIVLGLPLAGLLIWFIVGRGLYPIRDLATEMANKRSDDLSQVADTDPPRELALLIDSINDLLGRLERAFEREKRFAADAAHELRTPISVLKVQLHNLLRNTDGDDDQLRSLAAAVERIERSVEQVLMLYRTAPEQFAARFVDLDLVGLSRQVIADFYPQLDAKHQQIELDGEGVHILGDAFALQTLLRNLIENASKYSEVGGNIRVAVTGDGGAAILTVEDSGPGIPEEQRERVMERFIRGDGARNDTVISGSGIGLAIVKHVADIHGATISLDDSAFASGLAVSVSFPADVRYLHGAAT
jgi:two-component system sensor histidine kinase QseC